MNVLTVQCKLHKRLHTYKYIILYSNLQISAYKLFFTEVHIISMEGSSSSVLLYKLLPSLSEIPAHALYSYESNKLSSEVLFHT